MQDSEDTAELAIRAEKMAQEIVERLKALSQRLVLAESCTAGLVSSFLASTPGASKVLCGSFVCYTKEAKVSMLGLDSGELDLYGLVSAETAIAMASSAIMRCRAHLAAAVTGIAGPEGDGSGVPVGTVWAATSSNRGETNAAYGYHFTGSRNDIRLRAAAALLELIKNSLGI